MNKQEIFDKVAHHLLTQKERSLNHDNDCMYRGDNGMMCAVGCLIPDELYSPYIENIIATSDDVTSVLRSAGVLEYEEDDERYYKVLNLLGTLQGVHDSSSPDTWLRKLHNIAYNEGLSDDVLGEFK